MLKRVRSAAALSLVLLVPAAPARAEIVVQVGDVRVERAPFRIAVGDSLATLDAGAPVRAPGVDGPQPEEPLGARRLPRDRLGDRRVKVRRVGRRRWRATVDLRGLPRQRAVVRIRAGRKRLSSRVYRTCVPG